MLLVFPRLSIWLWLSPFWPSEQVQPLGQVVVSLRGRPLRPLPEVGEQVQVQVLSRVVAGIALVSRKSHCLEGRNEDFGCLILALERFPARPDEEKLALSFGKLPVTRCFVRIW